MPSDTTKDTMETGSVTRRLAGRVRRLVASLEDFVSTERNVKVSRAVLLLGTAFLLALLLIPSKHFHMTRYSAGDIASTDIKATQSYLVEDRELMEKKRLEAERAAPLVYELVPAMADQVRKRFARVFALVIDGRGSGGLDRESLRQNVSGVLGSDVTPDQLAAMERLRNFSAALAEIGHVVDDIYAVTVVADRAAFSADRRHGIVLYEQGSGRQLGAGEGLDNIVDLREAAKQVPELRLAGSDRREAASVRAVLAAALQPNLLVNRAVTEARQRDARAAVRPVVYQIERGEMIVREGERISVEQAVKLNSIFEVGRGLNRFRTGTGLFALLLVLLYFPYRFGMKNIRKFKPSAKDLLLLSLITVGLFAFLKVAYGISSTMGVLFPRIDIDGYFYLLPFAAGAMLVRIILNSEVALVYCAVTAPLVGILFDFSLPVVLYGLVGGIIGAHGVRQCQCRGTIYSAGLKVSVVNLAMAVSFQILTDNLFTSQTLYIMLFALVGGLLNALVVSGTVPVIESLFHYTTDIKLLELASLNSPVLRDLMIRAPGTYHHSILVGTMVEAAAEAIHANPLLARVAAYYHDIGKISKPLYFIENMVGGENRHDKLSPSMSALILTSHVKEGVELARERRLGRPIIDIIRQHHGTALITFFYKKAKDAEDPDNRTADERDFRYPGPKPQTREAGLVMLADCVEAASKTLSDPTPSRIQGMVQKIINNIFIDGQLDECELTLKNLHDIAKSFNRILAGIYHHRIDYPEPAFKVNGRKKTSDDSDREQAKAASGRGEDAPRSGGEDLKRLGIDR